jgi:hypothetical protein
MIQKNWLIFQKFSQISQISQLYIWGKKSQKNPNSLLKKTQNKKFALEKKTLCLMQRLFSDLKIFLIKEYSVTNSLIFLRNPLN